VNTSYNTNTNPSTDDNALTERNSLIAQFVGDRPQYYQKQFARIGGKAGFAWTFNAMAALLGPIWYGMRGLWNWGLPFVILETIAFIQIGRGLFGDLGAEARDRIAQIEGTLDLRREQLASAIEKQSDKVEVFERAINSLELAIADINAEVAVAEASAITVAMAGLVALAIIKLIEGVIANTALEKRFSYWLSDRTVVSGVSQWRTIVSTCFVLVIFAVSVIHFAFPGAIAGIATFPTDPQIRLKAISWIEAAFGFVKSNGRYVFESISLGIRTVLDYLEIVFVSSPWPVVACLL